MHALVRTVFSRLQTLDPVAEEEKLQTSDEEVQEGEVRMTVSSDQAPGEDRPSDVGPGDPTERVESIKSSVQQGEQVVPTRRQHCMFPTSNTSMLLNHFRWPSLNS